MFNRWLLGFAALALSACVSTSAEQAPPPNIVLIIADDLGYGDLGVYGGRRIATPNIDALAARGVRFTNGYVTSAVCAPSRASLLSGRYQQRFGYEFNPVRRDLEGVGIPQGVRILPEFLRERGYRTALIGKWHLGRTRETHPLNHGFDRFIGFSPGATGYLHAAGDGDEWLPDPVPGVPQGFFDMRLEEGYERAAPRDGYLTDILTDEALAFVDADRSRPFFLTLAYNAPHTPLQATRRYLERYAHIENQSERIYAAMVSALDDNVGRVLDGLEERGLTENTLVVFLSDNGCPDYIGEGVCSNAPFRGFKGMYLEGGVRVPMIVAWPGRLPRGRVYEAPVMSFDWSRSILAAAGAVVGDQPVDGVDVLPLVAAGRATPDRPLVWRTGPNYALRSGDWKLIVSERTDGAGFVTHLFNLRDDPGETRNLAAEHPEIVARLTREFEGWNARMQPPSFDSERRFSAPMAEGEPAVNLYN
ncbi:MAG: sulfatase [Caulobacterales bacterium]|jgi:arylsulfatase A-like enzyme|nr:sulfatase [Caulobacterales bacterium]